MVYGNPNCYTYAQNCMAGCCTYWGECPWAWSDYCYYSYYNYNLSRGALTGSTAIGVGVGVGVFFLVMITLFVICYCRRRRNLIGANLGVMEATTVVMNGGAPVAYPGHLMNPGMNQGFNPGMNPGMGFPPRSPMMEPTHIGQN